MATDPQASDDDLPDPMPQRSAGREGADDAGARRITGIEGYAILGELGRGSMGVVYKARDKTLGRLVALKMLVAGGHTAPNQLARFETEAHAAAALQHPNIVQIHQIGVSGGLPYLSLEYVDGIPLDRFLDATPQPPADAVRLIETLARAIHFAHQRHIVHRDLKPANVLVARDGTAKITDFGLAKIVDGSSSQTASGVLIGTPSYMAPEQASGELVVPGPAVDIHALGAILYEMLVGRPPYLGASPYETTMQVVNQEPVRPSRLVARLPTDVETICLKCLQKDPAKRYADAAGLAEDCRRFLAGEPILSRPISPPERLWRWCRRNPNVAGLAAAVASLLVIVTVGSTTAALMVTKERNEKERQRKVAVEARIASEAAKRDADANALLATEQANLALFTMTTLVDEVQAELDDAPRTQKLKRKLLEVAIEGLKAVSRRGEGSTSIETTSLAAHMQMGNMFRQLGATGDAMREYEICHDIARRRAGAFPDNDASQANFAAVLDVLGDMRQELARDMKASLESYEQALEIWKAVRAKPESSEGQIAPITVAERLAEAHQKVAVTKLRLGDPSGAIPLLQEAVRLRRELCKEVPDEEALDHDLARSCNALGEAAFLTGQPDLARIHYEECLALREKHFAASPDDPGSKLELANALLNSGDFTLRTGDLTTARLHYTRSLEIYRELMSIDENVIEYRVGVGLNLYRLGVLETLVGKTAAAAARFGECLEIREFVAATDRTNEPRQRELMLAVARSGDVRRAATLAEGIRIGRDDPERLIDLARCYALCSEAAAVDDSSAGDVYASQAVAAIEAARAAGYRDAATIRIDPDLNPIRGRSEFAALVGSFTLPRDPDASAGVVRP